MDEYISAYDLGWSDGYHDKILDCPFPEGSQEYMDYLEGFEQGCRDN